VLRVPSVSHIPARHDFLPSSPVYDYIAVGVSPDRKLHIPADMGNPSLYSEICYNDTCLEAGRWATL
jgi:hypothetical protein